MNIKMRKDGDYVIIEDQFEDQKDPNQLVAISPISDPFTDSLYLFWMSSYLNNIYDLSEKNNLIIDGVDLI